ncbi:hypothetical protein [Ornithinimicrobium kibberense]|uniref:hypothetical protein n=1 Tax=Ornithinimicrobium kibberense TaxID=282060 RepID=UPI00361C7DCD
MRAGRSRHRARRRRADRSAGICFLRCSGTRSTATSARQRRPSYQVGRQCSARFLSHQAALRPD